MDAGLNIEEIEGLGTGFRMNVVVLRLFSQSLIALGETECFDHE